MVREILRKELIYRIEPEDLLPAVLEGILDSHPEIKFISFAGIDLGGNQTEEKIPVRRFLNNIDGFLEDGVQTDGSSVVLPGIASLNDARVDLVADKEATWFVDYNFENTVDGRPVGTLVIPSFLRHRESFVGSRSVLKRAVERLKQEVRELLQRHRELAAELGIDVEEITDIRYNAATELEFWVKTPGEEADVEQLSVSQVLQEHYWKPTRGCVRTAMELSLLLMEKYGFKPEMGHKEVGGVKATLGGDGEFTHIMEQLEIDWEYDRAMQSADNELFIRSLIKEVFRLQGLEVTFMAKPIEGVAGNGKHTHLSLTAVMKDGKQVNLFTSSNPGRGFLSSLGWGALMGILKNFEAIGAFITNSNDAFRRLQPGFEAPVCTVASLGHDPEIPSRNRTVLIGLIREVANPLATRFELRAPNPHTNTHLALAAISQGMLDGMEFAAARSEEELEAEFCKGPGEEKEYLERDRVYRSEKDIFEDYTEEERNRYFGRAPSTVWEALENLAGESRKKQVLMAGGVFTEKIISSYQQAVLCQWATELVNRIIPESRKIVRQCRKLHGATNGNELDDQNWVHVNRIRVYLMRDSHGRQSLFTRIKDAIKRKDYRLVSTLQLELYDKIEELKKAYRHYKDNILDY